MKRLRTRDQYGVVYAGSMPGEATNALASAGRVLSFETTDYPWGGSDYAVHTDVRGKVSVSRTDILGDCVERGEAVFTNDVEVVRTKSRSYFGGGSSTRREWAGDKFTEERRFDDYLADGRRVAYVVTESSDCGVVTNSVTTYDLLGRVATTAVPGANGNITAYVDSIGAVVTEYVYDCFGRTISQSGPLADVFHHRFSSKYFDVETELYYYGYRFYSPDLHRWVSRDPICEEGGNNLYCFCGNDSVSHRDKNGCAYFAYRPLNVPLVGKLLGIRGITPYNADWPSNALRFFMSTRSRRNWVCPGSSRGSMPGDTRPRAGMTRVHR